MKITIQTNADFTPSGKRRVQIVSHKMNGDKATRHIRWFVGTRAYNSLPLTQENIELSREWLNIQTA